MVHLFLKYIFMNSFVKEVTSSNEY